MGVITLTTGGSVGESYMGLYILIIEVELQNISVKFNGKDLNFSSI